MSFVIAAVISPAASAPRSGALLLQRCLCWHYHEKAPPSLCTYLTSDPPFMPPRQQIAAVEAAGLSLLGCHLHSLTLRTRRVSVSQSSHLMPPPPPGHTRSHTREQTGWRTFLCHPLLSAPPFLVCVLMRGGGPVEGARLRGTLRLEGRRLCMCGGLIPQSCSGMRSMCSTLRLCCIHGRINGVFCFAIKARGRLCACLCCHHMVIATLLSTIKHF